MPIRITKMQGCGNDFIILNDNDYKTGIDIKKWDNMSDAALKLCNRNFGIGADGLIIPKTEIKNADIGWYFYNSDGTMAQMCGNGIRCFAKYVYDNNLINKKEFRVETLAGIITPKILDDGKVTVNMSKPILNSEKIPFKPMNNLNCNINVKGRTFKGNAVSMGNPHFVIFVESDEDILKLAKEYGPYIETADEFPEKTNVEFIKILSKNKIQLRVWERGCGITLACGTGACASTVAGILNNYLDNTVNVELLGGEVIINWNGNENDTNQDVFMTGPAEYVFKAELI